MNRVRTMGREVWGWTLLALAVPAFPLPVVPTLLVIAGLLVLSGRYHWAGKLLAKARKMLPSRRTNAELEDQNPATLS